MTENKGPAGEVWLVGAGCGRGLLTWEGRETLARAHTVLYDALVPLDGLREINPRAEWLPVGKRSGRHSMDQESINGLLIRKAREGKMVVRLKGGDSFVFGRGGEEALALQAAGISWHVVPGVSSSIAVPEHFGIPVTHRGLARSFTVVTGHTRDGQEEDWQALARLQGTLVFLMGLERLETICRRLILEGKAPDTPASILCGGYTSQEIRLDGTLADLPEKARAQGAFAPAIILVGPVAGLGLRPAREANPEKILWFRSARQDFRRLGQVRFACIGQGTAEELADQGFQADLMPEVFTAEALGRLLGETLEAGDRCLLLRAEEGSPDLVRELDRAGRKYRDVPLYRIRTRKILTGAETRLAPQVMIFGSGRGVREFFRRFTLAPETRVLCIGPVTARAAREAGCSQVETAAIHSAAGIRDALEKKGSRP